MSLIIAGNPSPRPGPVNYTRRRVGGNEEIRSWTGACNYVRAMESVLWSTGALEVSVNQAQGSAIATITARYAQQQSDPNAAIQETLSIDFNDVPFPLNLHTYFSSITKEGIAVLDKWVEDRQDIGTDPNLTGAAIESEYYWLRRMGVDSVRLQIPVITYTRTIPPNFPEPATVEDAGKIFTNAQVLDRVIAPILFTIPAPDVFSDDTFGFISPGWLYTTKVDYISDGNAQYIDKFEYGHWPNFMTRLS